MNYNLQGFDIPGWFKFDECVKLYELALTTDGPILEIGHFLGRSTSFICQGIRDSKIEKHFTSYDLGFTSYEEVQKFYFEMYGSDMKIPSMYDIAFLNNATTTEMAKIHLQKLNLDNYVNLVSGNFIELDSDKYNFIFSDAMHDVIEIENNLPHVIEHSTEKCLWAFHDMDENTINFVLKNSNVKYIGLVKTLGIFEYSRE